MSEQMSNQEKLHTKFIAERAGEFLQFVAELDTEKSEKERIARALKLAKVAHKGQFRDEGTPYVLHCIRVAENIARKWGSERPQDIVVGLLHDVVEDSETTVGDLQEEFGTYIASAVAQLSKNQDETVPRNERFREYYQRMGQVDEHILKVKLEDRLDNVRSLLVNPDKEKVQATIRSTKKHYLSLAQRVGGDIYVELQQALQEAEASLQAYQAAP